MFEDKVINKEIKNGKRTASISGRRFAPETEKEERKPNLEKIFLRFGEIKMDIFEVDYLEKNHPR